MPSYTRLVIASLLVVSVASCDLNKKEDCVALDNTIAAINDTLMIKSNAWGEEFEIAVNTLDFSQLNGVRMDMQSFIENKIDVVEGLEPIGEAEDLIQAQLDFLKYEHDVVTQKFSVFEQYDTTVTMEELKNSYINLQLGSDMEQELSENVHRKREDYADLNGFPKFIDKN